MNNKNIVDFKTAQELKEFVSNASDRIFELEDALYQILDSSKLDVAKELAADVLGEDLESFLEEEKFEELDFEDDTNVAWDMMPDEEK